jgi:cytoskeletal protein CcmA (bactofilin family)
MFSRNSEKGSKSYVSSSVIGTEMQIKGNIKCSGNLVIKGKVNGNIECEHINLASEGNLKGNIKSMQSVIGGNFEGDVFADSLAIESTASIKGNLYYNSLRAQPGAKLDVELFMGLEKKGKTNNKEDSTNKKSTTNKADNKLGATKKTKKV